MQDVPKMRSIITSISEPISVTRHFFRHRILFPSPRSANKFQNTWTSETIADPVDKQENKSLSRRRTSNTIPGTRKKKRSLFSFPFRRAPYSRWRGEPTPMLRQKEYTGRGGTSARDASERNRANATHARIHASSYLVEWHVHAKGEATRGTP